MLDLARWRAVKKSRIGLDQETEEAVDQIDADLANANTIEQTLRDLEEELRKANGSIEELVKSQPVSTNSTSRKVAWWIAALFGILASVLTIADTQA